MAALHRGAVGGGTGTWSAESFADDDTLIQLIHSGGTKLAIEETLCSEHMLKSVFQFDPSGPTDFVKDTRYL